jgi:hypothetical protein
MRNTTARGRRRRENIRGLILRMVFMLQLKTGPPGEFPTDRLLDINIARSDGSIND